jgi:hypothetical protein
MKTSFPISLILILLLTSCTIPSETSSSVVQLQSPSSSGSGEPHLHTAANGDVFLSWVENREETSALKYSRLTGTEWSDPSLIAEGPNWFVNWADYPMVSTNGSAFMALYLERSGAGTYAYSVKVTRSDSGKVWSAPTVLHDDGKQTEHGFLAVQPYGENFFVTWLDGRNMVMEGHDEHQGSMSLRAAIIDKAGQKMQEWELDNRTCDCCQTDAAITDNGPVVVYRDRSDDEIRDMSIVRFVDGNWTSPVAVYNDNWKIKGCPVNGPRISAIGNDVAVAWFSVVDSKPQVNVSFSKDGGATFQGAVRMNNGPAIGRVDVVMIDDRSVWVSWMEGNAIRAARVNSRGEKDDLIIVAEASESRSGGFPQMTRYGNKLVFAWTDEQAKTIRTAIKDM